MSPLQFIFLAVAAVTLLAAVMVVSARSLVHAALWLVLTLFGVAVLYVLLNAGFFAVAQVLIYIGAIAQNTGPTHNPSWWLAALIAAGGFGGLFLLFNSWDGFTTQLPELANEGQTLADLGKALVGPYLLPFELASVLLVAAMVGAIYVSYPKK
jgi:NADH-quinone oxidoreductase subunit J